ncbi:MAG: hypothetical protein IPJ81_10395 [Chitinophagaceae bacterium]|nr:hypothetical protein [Chitinophagaceae bacterium]
MTDHLNNFSEETGCPKCSSLLIKPVKYTWWGGVIGPKLLHHTKCEECKYTFNSKTRKSNKNGIIIYSVIVFVVFFLVFFFLRMRY